MSGWQPFDPVTDASLPADEALAALAAALRAVRGPLRAVAEAQLMAPSWRPGETAEHAAYVEGGKAVWRTLLALAERGAP